LDVPVDLQAYSRDPVDTLALERAIRTGIHREFRRRIALRLAAVTALVIPILAGYSGTRRSREAKIYYEAALDQRAEVV
jgi:hypothetical protein